MTTARHLAEFLIHATPSGHAMEHAAMVVASTLASAAYGTGIASAQIVSAMARDKGGRPDASIWFDNGPKLPVAEAARANAVLSDAAASDDSDLRNIVHAGTPAAASALAFAERDGADGEKVLRAIVLGYEAAGRIGEAITPSFKDRGFHACIAAAFASAVASGIMLGLTVEQLTHTIALTATSVGGIATAADTSVSREYHAGAIVSAGVTAALAAQRGFAGEPRVLEAKRGFFEAFGGVDGVTAAAATLRGLGESWDIVTDMAIKLVPGGHPWHAIGEAAGNAARAGGLQPSDIATITIHRPGMTALHPPLHPKDLIDMAHSPANFAAAGAADHGFAWVHASAAKIADPVIHALIDKVRVGAEPVEHAGRYRQGATVVIGTTDGRSFSATVFEPSGSAALGISWAQIAEKYRTLMPAAGVTDAAIEASLTAIQGFRELTGVSALIRSLGAASRIVP